MGPKMNLIATVVAIVLGLGGVVFAAGVLHAKVEDNREAIEDGSDCHDKLDARISAEYERLEDRLDARFDRLEDRFSNEMNSLREYIREEKK